MWSSEMSGMITGLAIWILVASVVTAMLYAWDKRAAIKGNFRVAENTLLACSLLGGWPGGMIASQLVRHKTQKVAYRLKFALCVILNVVTIATLLLMSR